VNLGTGAILLLAAQTMQTGGFAVGNLAVFTYLLTWITQLTQSLGSLITRYQQAGVSVDRMITLLQGVPPQVLVGHLGRSLA
jgi:ATP-binding cassette subfamily B protein